MNDLVKRYNVAVGIIYNDKTKKFLVLKHNKCKGLYLFPSGKKEPGENIKETLILNNL